MDAFLEELEPRQFAEWMAADELQPWGEERDDLRFGLLVCALELMFRGSDGEPAFSPEDFLMFKVERAAGEQNKKTPEMEAAAARMNLELFAAARRANAKGRL